MTGQQRQGVTPAAKAIIVGASDRMAFSLDQDARWRRAFARAGIEEVRRDTDPLPEDGAIVLVRGDLILEGVLTKALSDSPDTLLFLESGGRSLPAALPF